MFTSNSDIFKKIPTTPTERRVGFIRTFHHKLYEDEEWEKKSIVGKCCHFYCQEHWTFCLLIMISMAILVTGALSALYGFLLPSLYRLMDVDEANATVKFIDSVHAHKYKELFVIIGISLSAVGIILCVSGACLPLYKSSEEATKFAKQQHTPIVVDYELPPYETSLEHGNYKLVENGNLLPGGIGDPLPVLESNDMFQTFLVQEKLTH